MESVAEMVRECRGSWDPVQAHRKTRGMAADVVREDRMGSLRRLFLALTKIHTAENFLENLEMCGQEAMLRREKNMAEALEAERKRRAGGDVL